MFLLLPGRCSTLGVYTWVKALNSAGRRVIAVVLALHQLKHFCSQFFSPLALEVLLKTRNDACAGLTAADQSGIQALAQKRKFCF